MCGIAGISQHQTNANPRIVEDLIDQLGHRGPDDQGVWQSHQKNCVLGQARLSIIDLSAAGHQPLIDPETGNAITFNGEVYNFQSLRKRCEQYGYRFNSATDTEVVLALYRYEGVSFVKHLRGMFALAIWDEAKQQLFLARDRMGQKPLVYAQTDSTFLFSSEINPLARYLRPNLSVDPYALELYLQLQYVPAPRTIYQEIRKLPPAHYAIVKDGKIQIERYWQLDYRHKVNVSEAEAGELLLEKLKEAVRLRLISDVPLGALLSGGVDSGLVVALMSEFSSQPVKTFSIGFAEQGFNELPYAKMVADRYQTDHHRFVLEPDVKSVLPKLVKYYGEPFADSSAIPSFFVSQMARQKVTVALNGDGGDELLGGYSRYRLNWMQALGRLTKPANHAPRLSRLVGELQGEKSLPEKVYRRLFLKGIAPELQGLIMYPGVQDENLPAILNPAHRNGTAVGETLWAWRQEAIELAGKFANHPIDRMLCLDNHTYLPGDLLVKMDIASMACGLETRSPLLDHELIETCASLPPQYKAKANAGKYLLKKVAEPYLPHDILYRPKKGFSIPLASWLRTDYADMVQDSLLHTSALDTYFNKPYVEQVVGSFYAGNDQATQEVWTLFMFAMWHQTCFAV